jgi:hypothetical protein
MNKYFLLILFLASCYISAQTEKLFFFIEKDSLLGVKDQNGNIIISAKPSWNSLTNLNNREIKSEIFNIDFKDKLFAYYNRKGEFLFQTFMTSEGPDGFQEGFIRYRENNKSGLYSYKGKKITLAKYDWISSINFGFALFCNGCYFDTSKDEEHAPLVGGTWGFVGKNGIEIIPTDERNHPKDFETTDHHFIPYQFHYNHKKKQILNFFEKRKKQIAQINGLNCNEKTLYFEIFKKPTEYDNFYRIKLYELYNSYLNGADENYDDFKNFKVTADGKKYFVLYVDLVNYKDYSEYVERKIPLDTWIKQNINKLN